MTNEQKKKVRKTQEALGAELNASLDAVDVKNVEQANNECPIINPESESNVVAQTVDIERSSAPIMTLSGKRLSKMRHYSKTSPKPTPAQMLTILDNAFIKKDAHARQIALEHLDVLKEVSNSFEPGSPGRICVDELLDEASAVPPNEWASKLSKTGRLFVSQVLARTKTLTLGGKRALKEDKLDFFARSYVLAVLRDVDKSKLKPEGVKILEDVLANLVLQEPAKSKPSSENASAREKVRATSKKTNLVEPSASGKSKKAKSTSVKKTSKSGLIKQGLCPHDETKLTFDKKTHRATCSKCGHVIYFKSNTALGCLTCLGRVAKPKADEKPTKGTKKDGKK
jgi:hypothetical protein